MRWQATDLLDYVLKLNRILREHFVFESTLQAAVLETAKFFNLSLVAILRVEGDQLVPMAVSPAGTNAAPVPLADESFFSARVIQTGRPAVIQPVTAQSPLNQRLAQEMRITAVASFPIQDHGDVIGTLMLASSAPGFKFSSEAIKTLNLAADQLGSVMRVSKDDDHAPARHDRTSARADPRDPGPDGRSPR